MFAAVWLLLLLTCVYIGIQVLLVAVRNHKGHKFFAAHAPDLPVVPDRPNIFSGHLTRVIIRDDSVQTIAELHKQLGPTFGFYRCEQPWVLTKDLDLLKLIEMDEPNKHINRSKYGLPFKEFRHSIFQARDDAWRRMRRAVAPALTNRKMRSEETTGDIESVLEQLAAGIKSRIVECETDGGRSMILDAGDMFQRYTLAVIFLIAYQREREIDFISGSDNWISRLDSAARRVRNPFAATSVMFPFMRPVIEQLVKLHPVGQMNMQLVDYVKRAVDLNQEARERKSPGLGGQMKVFKRRVVDTIIDALFDKRIKYDEFMGTTQFLLLAGFQTTADAITCLVWQLARHPEIQEQLRSDIRNYGIDSEYFEWCLKETIRFHPPVPLGVGRILGEAVHVNGLRLPRGTYVMPSTHAIHHDPNIWPDPEKFKPERWRQAAEFHPAAFMGFGLGPRNCVGAKLATHETKLAIIMLLENYRIEKCPETPEEYGFSAPAMIFTLMNVPVKVRLVELEQNKRVATCS